MQSDLLIVKCNYCGKLGDKVDRIIIDKMEKFRGSYFLIRITGEHYMCKKCELKYRNGEVFGIKCDKCNKASLYTTAENMEQYENKSEIKFYYLNKDKYFHEYDILECQFCHKAPKEVIINKFHYATGEII